MNKRTVIATLPFAALVVFAAGWWATAGSLTPPAVGPTVPTDRITLSDLLTPLPITITAPGSYVLTSDLNDNGAGGITIAASDVDIDLNGFAIVGTGSPFDGIVANAGLENITVHDGEVRQWGNYGVDLSPASGVHVYNLAVTGNVSHGLLVGPGSRVDSVRVERNAGAGIITGDSSVLTNSIASENAGYGVIAGNDNRVANCVANSNGGTNPNWDGFFCSYGCSFEGCTAQYNAGQGIKIGFGVVTDCVTDFNSQNGIRASSSLIERNSAAGNGLSGIEVVSECGVIDNQVLWYNTDGILVTGEGNRIEDNHIVTNYRYAIDTFTVAGGLANVVLSNREHGNPAGYNLDFATNTYGPIFTGPGPVTVAAGQLFANISY